MTRRRCPPLLLGPALLMWLGATPTARASSPEADEAIEHGVELRRAHRDDLALSEFQRAYAIEATPRALAQAALAEAALGQWVPAESDLVRALAFDDPWIEKQRRVLHLALGEVEAHLGTLQLSGPQGGQVWIDGALAAHLPSPLLRVPAKHLVIELRAAGFEPETMELDLAPEATARANFSPRRIATDPPIAEERTAPLPVSPGPSAGAWVTAGVSVLALATGVVLTVVADDRASHYNDDAACGDLPGFPRSVRCAGLASDARTAQVASWAAYGLSAAAATASTLLFVFSNGHSPKKAAVSIGPIPAGATLRLDF